MTVVQSYHVHFNEIKIFSLKCAWQSCNKGNKIWLTFHTQPEKKNGDTTYENSRQQVNEKNDVTQPEPFQA